MSAPPRGIGTHPHAHFVQFYDDEELLFGAVSGFVGEGLARAESAIVIATPPHRAAIAQRLTHLGFDLSALEGAGRLAFHDAAGTLDRLMVDGAPQWEKFRAVIGAELERLRAAAGGGRIRAFGEMVDVLWRGGNTSAAVRLEELWNDLGREYSFALHCAYPMTNFHREAHREAFDAICGTHDHVTTDGMRIGPASLEAELARLQQRERALETEIRSRQKLEEALQEALRERDRTEAELRASRAELQDFLENAVVPLHWVGPDGRILWANQAELDLLGYSREEYIGRHIAEVHADALRIEEILHRLARREELRDFEATLRCKDGTLRHVLIDSNVMWRDDKFVHTRCFTRDVTVRKRAHDALLRLQEVTSRLSEARTPTEVADVVLSRGVDALGAAAGKIMLVTDDGGHLELMRAVGYPDEVVATYQRVPVGSPLPVTEVVRSNQPVFLCSPDDFRRYPDLRASETTSAIAVLPLTVQGRPIGSVRFNFRDARTFDVDDRAFLSALADQCAQALERARLFEAEKGARERAEDAGRRAAEADRRKDEFLAMLGHELRNPLAPILTALQIMQLRGAGGDREQRVIERQVQHLVRLVDDLLDVSRITRGKVQLKKERLEISTALARAIEMASPLLEQRSHSLTLQIPRSGLEVDADPVRLSQVLANLLTNAAKYTDAGGRIHVAAVREGGEVVVRVRDNGTGMSPELVERVFELFLQGDRTLDRSQGGLGIGLTLARSLLELHGGTIAAHSEGLGKGSEFVVRLPAVGAAGSPEADHAPVRDFAPVPPTGRNILLVDDNVDAADMLGEALRALGHRVVVAHDGPSALALAANEVLDTALLDIGLPVMDGYELATRLRESGRRLRLIAVTGYGQDSDRQRALEAGFEVHLVKPIDLDGLAALLRADEGASNAPAAVRGR